MHASASIAALGPGGVAVSSQSLFIVAVIGAVAVAALVIGTMFRAQVLRADDGTPAMREIALAIQEGATVVRVGTALFGERT